MFDTKQMTDMAEKFSELYKTTGMEPQKFFEGFQKMMPPTAPSFKSNKSGYEIRTKVLEMAQSQMWQDYHTKWGQFETSMKKDGDEIVTEVAMPEVPGADKVLEAAELFYNFVTGSKTYKK
jgi:hypothetical protein